MMAVALAACPVLLGGCVERVLQIRSDPPGAEVRIDGQVVGVTPHDEPFHWYGGREVELRLSGYKTVRVIEEVEAPWYQVFPMDLITDLLIPFTIRDHRELKFYLQEAGEPAPVEKVRERADELRKRLDQPD